MIDLSTFDIEFYEYCDHPSMADLHVIVPGKFVAMKGPHARATFKDGVQFLPPSRYFNIFEKLGVTAVVRLNSEQYPAKAFRDAGFNHYDIIYDDCTNPDQAVIDAWWEVCRQEKGAIAVHCKAGLGRTVSSFSMLSRAKDVAPPQNLAARQTNLPRAIKAAARASQSTCACAELPRSVQQTLFKSILQTSASSLLSALGIGYGLPHCSRAPFTGTLLYPLAPLILFCYLWRGGCVFLRGACAQASRV